MKSLKMKMKSYVILLLAVSVIAYAQCYESGKVYRYSYVTDLALNEPPSNVHSSARRNTGLKLEATIEMSVIWAQDTHQLMKLKVYDAKLYSASKSSKHIDLGLLSDKPAYFSRVKGVITRVYVSGKEKTLSLNIKNGIISMFQFQTMDGKTSEVDVSGVCDVMYVLDRNIITKTRSHCSNLEIAGQYQNSNELLDIDLDAVSSTTYELAGNVIKTAATTEQFITRLNLKRDLGCRVQQRQHLMLEDDQGDCPDELPGNSLGEAVAMLKKARLLNEMMLSSDTEAKQCGDECVKPAALMEQYRDLMYKTSMARVDTASAFIELVESFRYASQKTIREILDNPDNAYSIPELIDVAVAAQNTAAQDALLEFVAFDDAYDEEVPERYLFATSFSTHPPERVLTDLLSIAKKNPESPKVEEATLLALGAVVFTFCRVDDCKAQIITDIREFLEQRLEACKEQDCRLHHLRALGNAGMPESIPTLLRYGEGHTDQETCLAALQSLRRMERKYIDEEVKQIVTDMYFQTYHNYSVSVRTLAATILIKYKPTVDQLRNIIQSTISRDEFETSTYIYKRILDVARQDSYLRKTLAVALKDKYTNNYYALSHNGTSSAFTGSLGETEDVDVKYGLFIENTKLGMLRRSSMDVTLDGKRHSLPLISVGMYAEGMESVVGTGEEEAAEGSGAEAEEASGGMVLTFLDVMLRPIQFFKGMGGLMSAVWSAPSEPVSALQGNILLHDYHRLIRLQNGLVVDLDLKSCLSLDLSGSISISLWNKNSNSVVRNSGALVINGKTTIDASIFKTGLDFTAESESFMDFTSDVDFSDQPTRLCLQMSQPELEFKYTTNRYETLRGEIVHKSTYTNTDEFPALSYLLNRHNSKSCHEMLEEGY
ncbi:microsomal triglyceride transfer protein large subunit-like isoform X2 [Lineus longissimus]|uniref:microsomal triglyceride transfer protein large subunit-like isoform X2 n=1 Tax=Lineus longissimus TaxID=88925 RepID=UPI002B4DED11